MMGFKVVGSGSVAATIWGDAGLNVNAGIHYHAVIGPCSRGVKTRS